MRKIVVLLGIASDLTAGCNSGNMKVTQPPNPRDEARQIQNDPTLSPEMKARLLRQEQGAGNQPRTK